MSRPGGRTLEAREACRHENDDLAGLVVDPALARPAAFVPEWTHTIPTGSAGTVYCYDPATASEGEALLLFLVAPTYEEQPPRTAWAGPLDAGIHLDSAGRCRLQRCLAAVVRYADEREPCQWASRIGP